MNGVSTIGNTLPNDIVEVLRDFRCDDPNFTTEPDYEFYIPECMLETISCPVDSEFTEHDVDSISSAGVCCPGVNKDNGSCTLDSNSSSESDEE